MLITNMLVIPLLIPLFQEKQLLSLHSYQLISSMT